MLTFWLKRVIQPLDCARYMNKNRWRSVDTHFQKVLAILSIVFLPIRRPIQWLWVDAVALHIDYPRCNNKNCWRSFDTHLFEVVVISTIVFLPTKVANAQIMTWQCYTTLRWSKMRDQKSSTLHWCSFWRGRSDIPSHIFAYNGGQYFLSGLMSLQSPWNIPDAWPTIMDASLMVIFQW